MFTTGAAMSGKIVIRIVSMAAASALLAVSAGAQTPAAQTKPRKATLDAFSVWQTEGQIVPISTAKAVVTGTLGGALFIETDDGPEDSGDVVCPATIEIDLKTGHQIGQGYCTFTAYDEAKVFGSWRCEGTLSEGCDGQFNITGGTRRLASITGKSDISFFASRHDLRVTQQTTVADKAGGITIWPGLSVTLRQAMTAK
jgi:hypothetical protein